jgi:hypothetical protein
MPFAYVLLQQSRQFAQKYTPLVLIVIGANAGQFIFLDITV